MLDQQQLEILETAFRRGQALQSQPVSERVASLEASARNNLANFSILGMSLDFEGIKSFFETSGLPLPESEHLAWLEKCLEIKLLTQSSNAENDALRWIAPEEVYRFFITHSKSEEVRRYHLNADKFLLDLLALMASDMGIRLPEGCTRREAIIGPYGFLNQIAHLPQYQEFHQGVINFAINWYDHLFLLDEYVDAANVLNHICFALARRGQRKMAENLLALIASKTTGLTHLVARINLATLLREESQNSAAMRLYWQVIPGLLRQRAFVQLAQVLTEMAVIYRQNGNLVRSVMVLEFGALLNGRLKNGKSQAIARSQLSSTYRYLRIYRLALNSSKLAVEHFRKTNDLLNLGRSLLTQGNIHYNQSRSDSALDCFEEALRIGQQIADPQATIGAISGKARVFLSLNRYSEAQSLLEEAISLRERRNDHNIGIEYQNLGALYEQKGNLVLALAWHQKALAQLEKYMPVEAANCRRRMAAIEAKLRAR